MPHRNLSFEAVVLRARESPGGSRIVTLLAADRGLVDAFVFGGPKSRLRSLASPYHSGRAWVYLDPVKDLRKLSDFDAQATYPTLRENLRKIWSASFQAEAVLRTDAAGGESRAAWRLLTEGLAALDAAEDSDIDYINVQYGWRLLDLMGLKPDPESCARCGAEFGDAKAFFAPESGVFVCPRCGADGPASGSAAVQASSGALRYLSRTGILPFKDALRVRVAEEDLATLKAVVFHMVRAAAEGELRTLARGEYL
jgi:DNA repair protein RecO (recombination protein O)